ncbi:hypothetical protein A2U01_0072908, partial [Trifolium medium]|nr:hypothetical protein [Trifolium medium]
MINNQTMDEPNAGVGGVEPDNNEKGNSDETLQNQPNQTAAHDQDSSTQETSNDDDFMQEAEAGGSDMHSPCVFNFQIICQCWHDRDGV